jgi:hypothetical protein
MCSGYWETCNCEDCKKVSGLYEDLKWYERDKKDNEEIIKEIEDKIEGMGYSV